MSADHVARKDLKRSDEFQRGAAAVVSWIMQRRKSIALVLLFVVAGLSVLAGVRSYQARQEQNAAAMLAVALQAFNAQIAGLPTTVPASSPAGPTYETEEAKLEAAIPSLQAVIGAYGTYPSGRVASVYLGASLARLGRSEEAEASLRAGARAAAPLPRAMSLLRLGELFAEQERYADAIEVFEQVINDPPRGFPIEEALAAKARAHEAAGETREAMLAHQRIVDNHEGSVYAQSARTRAAELAADLGLDPAAER